MPKQEAVHAAYSAAQNRSTAAENGALGVFFCDKSMSRACHIRRHIKTAVMSEMSEMRVECMVPDEAVSEWPEKRCYTVEDLQNILMCSKGTVYELLKKKEF